MLKLLVTTTFCWSVLLSLPGFSQTPVSQITAQDAFDFDRDWGLSYFNFSSSDAYLTDEGPSSWSIYQFIAFNYRFDHSRRLSTRFPFTTTTPGAHDRFRNVRNFGTQGGDLHFVYNHFNAIDFPNEVDMSMAYYLYLPTSENSQQRRWIARTRAWFNFEKKVSRRALLALWVKPEYFFNTQKSFRSERTNTAADGTTFTRVNARANTQATLETSIVGTYAINETFSPQVSLVYDQSWNETSEFITDPNYRDSFGLQLATWINVNRTVRFLVGYSNNVGLTNSFTSQDIRLLDANDSQYFVMTFWNLF